MLALWAWRAGLDGQAPPGTREAERRIPKVRADVQRRCEVALIACGFAPKTTGFPAAAPYIGVEKNLVSAEE